MRERVKYRGKLKGDWCYGAYIGQGLMFKTEGEFLFNVWIDVNDVTNVRFDAVTVDSETVGQFTGLNDATKWESLSEQEQSKWVVSGKKPEDWKGREIYEGDICSVEYGKTPVIGYIFYHLGCFCMLATFEESAYLYEVYERLNVIGNIYDNPELMKGFAK